MPHITIEYSANLESSLNVDDLLDAVHRTARSIEAFPVGGLRVRAARREHFRIADNDPNHCFVHTHVRIGQGRDETVKREIAERLFASVQESTAAVFESRGLALSLELEEIDERFSLKRNNIHKRLGSAK